jgi:hypothetical protein
MIIILSGHIGGCCTGGQAWANMQYLLGLRALGHEVFYLEDCGETSWVYDWDAEELTTELDYPARYIRDCLHAVGLGDRWIYRAGEESRGMGLADFLEVCSQADLLIVRASPIRMWRAEYDRPRRRVFIDVDPGFTQMKLLNGDQLLLGALKHCDRFFTISQRIAAPDCRIPNAGVHWLKTRPPVALQHWRLASNACASHFSSVMRWKGYAEVTYNRVTYGHRDREFAKFVNLPQLTPQRLRIALLGLKPERLTEHGWEVVPGETVARTPTGYHSFIQQSRAEFGVAKHVYVATRGGWFSDRSVAYLASGKPVLVQDTGLGDWLPLGEGVVAFRDLPEAVRGIELINSDYERQRRAARRLVELYFDAERVLPTFLDAAMG